MFSREIPRPIKFETYGQVVDILDNWDYLDAVHIEAYRRPVHSIGDCLLNRTVKATSNEYGLDFIAYGPPTRYRTVIASGIRGTSPQIEQWQNEHFAALVLTGIQVRQELSRRFPNTTVQFGLIRDGIYPTRQQAITLLEQARAAGVQASPLH